MGKYAIAFESAAYLCPNPRFDWWVAANEATRPQQHNASFGACLFVSNHTIAIPIQRLTHPLLFTLALAVYVDFEEDGIQYTAALLVAAAPIAAGESVCVHYGESYAPHRTWDAADPCEPPRVHKVDLVSFLNQHCLLDLHDITHMCLARNTAHAAYSVLPDLPKQLPKTVIVD